MTESESWDSRPPVCPECHAVVPPAAVICPECGHRLRKEVVVKEDDTPLVEVAEQTGEWVISVDSERERLAFMASVQRCRQMRRMDGRPYSLKAALVWHRQEFGRWPKWGWQKEAGIR